MSVTISLSALVCMACLFTPKVSTAVKFMSKLCLVLEASGRSFSFMLIEFFKFNIAVRLNNLFDGRCGTANF